jgi:VWFA-related protein
VGRGVRLAVLLGLLGAGSTGATPQDVPAPVPPPLTFAAGVDLILVDAVVTDGEGRLVTGLHADDFVIREDGQPQEITSFEAVDLRRPTAAGASPARDGRDREAPRVFVLALDDSGLGLESAIAARGAARKFLFAAARDGDLVNLVVPGTGLTWSARLPDGMGRLLSIVDSVEGRRAETPELGGGWEAVGAAESLDPLAQENLRTRLDANGQLPRTARFANESDQAYEARNREFQEPLLQSDARRQLEQDRDRRRRLFVGVSSALDSVAEVRGRKSVLLFSEGFVREPNDPPFRELVAALRRNNASIYFVNVLGLTSGAAADSRQAGDRSASSRVANPLDAAGADMVADETGGFSVKSRAGLETGLARIAEEASSYYLLGYAPQNVKRDGKYRQLQVAVRQADWSVRARKGYFGASERAASRASTKGGPDPELDAAFRSALPAKAIPVRLATFAQEPVDKGRVRIRVAAEVGLKSLGFETSADGARVATLDVALALNHVRPDGRLKTPWREWKIALPATAEAGDPWAAIETGFEVPAGAAQAQLVVRDRRSRAIGSLRQDFDVPEPTTWRVATPILSDLPGGERDRPRLKVDRTFVAGARLYCYLEVYPGARKKDVSPSPAALAYTLVDASGKTRRTGPATPLATGTAGVGRRLETIPLSGLAPGAYELRLVVRDAAGHAQELREPLVLRRPDRPDAAIYADLVQAFLAGDAERASAGVMEWRAKDLEKLAEALAPDDLVRRRAALQLHTALAFRLWAHARAPEAEAQIAIARAVLAKDPPAGLQRDWLLEVGYFQLAGSSLAKALDYFDDATRLYPESAEAWLGAGMCHEFTAFPDGFVFAAGTTRDAAGKATRAYRQAARLDAGLLEARLRLGRVLGLSGAYEEAEKEFAAVESSGDGRLTSLARIFQGGLRDARGDLLGAVRHYEAALLADPESSMAAFALSEALHRSGRHGPAADALAAALRPSTSTELSPWFAYHLGRGHRNVLLGSPTPVAAVPTFTAGSEP